MKLPFKKMTDHIIALGMADLPHTRKTYLAHVISVYRDMKTWGADEELCRAAMYHSVYGTQGFKAAQFSIERREELRQLIGDRAERIAYGNCAMDRDSFDAQLDSQLERYLVGDRITGGVMDLSPADYDDLARLHLCDWLEQVQRSDDRYFRFDAYRKIAERLGGVALAAFQREFHQETPSRQSAG